MKIEWHQYRPLRDLFLPIPYGVSATRFNLQNAGLHPHEHQRIHPGISLATYAAWTRRWQVIIERLYRDARLRLPLHQHT